MTESQLKKQDELLKARIKTAIVAFQENTGITINKLKVKCFTYEVIAGTDVQSFDYRIDFEI